MEEHQKSKLLDFAASRSHEDQVVRIDLGGEIRSYTLKKFRKRGQTGVTWLAEDVLGKNWAIKFVLKKEYVHHSLEAEVRRVAKITTEHLAKIEFYGNPLLESDNRFEKLYAIVVEWIPGETLSSFLHTNGHKITLETCLQIVHDLCEVVAELKDNELSHNDLHDENVMIVVSRNRITESEHIVTKVIDTGTLKLEVRRLELLDAWSKEIESIRLVDTKSEAITKKIELLEKRIGWFSRKDEEWIVYHISTLLNCLISRLPELEPTERVFLRRVRPSVNLMLDSNLSTHRGEPSHIYSELTRLVNESKRVEEPSMTSPFDLMSAELIRDDKHLMALFSDEFPGLDTCRSNDPVYVYGPRGCGKSTVFRSLSLRTILQSGRVHEELSKVPFIGVYVSCTSELRSRFWLLEKTDFALLEPHIVRFFNLLLVEELTKTLASMVEWESKAESGGIFGVSSVAIELARAIRKRLDLDGSSPPFDELTVLQQARLDIRFARDDIWSRILRRESSAEAVNAQLLFDLCEDLTDICPVLRERRITFLLDDYSNQRIRPELQQRLNQAIAFAKHGNPIFKVASEYEGVDLTGIHQGREVRELNVGKLHTELHDRERYRFLQSVLQNRFAHFQVKPTIDQILPPSRIGPQLPMAKAILEGAASGTFRYHGIDTISDICSGDFATALDLVRRIFERSNESWRHPPIPISPQLQHDAIHSFAQNEIQQVRYLAPNGQQKFLIVERLCWLARQCVLKRKTRKDGVEIPLIKIHIDISEAALRELGENNLQYQAMFEDLVRKGVLFPIDASRDVDGQEGTRRFQIRRILLAYHPAPLGRHTPIRIGTSQRLLYMLTEPDAFVRSELGIADSASESLFE